MLDFYIIEDDKPKPRDPEQMSLTHAGGLDDKTFHNLQKKGIIDQRFDFYSDFRWGTQLVSQMQQTIQRKNMGGDTDVQKLVLLLDLAGQKESGLIAYGD
jgi:hypothetical protein